MHTTTHSSGQVPIAEKLSVNEVPPEFALPSPPRSSHGSREPEPYQDSTIVSVSTAFFPGVEHTPSIPDLILMTSDNVFFYVHSHRILTISNNAFDSKWPPATPDMNEQEPPLVMVPESSPVLNLVLHVAYYLPCNQYATRSDEVVQAVDAIAKYGLPLQLLAQPKSNLYNLILSRAPVSPLMMYVSAASHGLEDLAVAISSHLLSFDLSGLNDELVEKMGAVYLRRLIFLHLGRTAALKRLLSPPPAFHGPTNTCGFPEQRQLMRAWSLATAGLAWDARPDLSPTSIESALGSLVELLHCPICRDGVKETVKNIIAAWANIKTTI